MPNALVLVLRNNCLTRTKTAKNVGHLKLEEFGPEIGLKTSLTFSNLERSNRYLLELGRQRGYMKYQFQRRRDWDETAS